jgi:hypothetical protein
LKSKDVYDLDREATRRPYDESKVRVVREGIVPRDLHGLVGPAGQEVLRDPERYVLKTDEELKRLQPEDFNKPYTDPLLKRKGQMEGLLQKLHQIDFLTFRRRARAKVGLFTVEKKGGGFEVDRRLPRGKHTSPYPAQNGSRDLGGSFKP